MITDEQIEAILSLIGYKAPADGSGREEWWGHDTDMGTTQELGKQIRNILEPEDATETALIATDATQQEIAARLVLEKIRELLPEQ